MSTTLPISHSDLVERPLFGHLATIRPDGSPQSSVMWFSWDGELLRFTHTSQRQKFVNLADEPRVAMSIIDPDDHYRFLEIRGAVESIEPDPDAAFYQTLQRRYGTSFTLTDTPYRVVITVRPDRFVAVANGTVVR